MTNERRERRGFASMSPEKQREIASKGGRAAHEKGTAHEWTADEARNAGRKGGQVSRGGRGRLVEPASAAPSLRMSCRCPRARISTVSPEPSGASQCLLNRVDASVGPKATSPRGACTACPGQPQARRR